jgi:hypothetical protein
MDSANHEGHLLQWVGPKFERDTSQLRNVATGANFPDEYVTLRGSVQSG